MQADRPRERQRPTKKGSKTRTQQKKRKAGKKITNIDIAINTEIHTASKTERYRDTQKNLQTAI